MPIVFADDTNLFATGYNLSDMVSETNKESANIYAWVKSNKLSLNTDKTKFMHFTPKWVPRSSIKDIFIDGNKIMVVIPNFCMSSLIVNKKLQKVLASS